MSKTEEENMEGSIESLRQQITKAARGAVAYGGVPRDWADAQLANLGAEPTGGMSEYRLNVPVSGVFGVKIHAKDRADALAKFAQNKDELVNVGKVVDCHTRGFNIYDVTVADAEPTFYAGPEDAPANAQAAEMGIDDLKAAIHAMIKEGVADHGWDYWHAAQQLASMSIAPLPPMRAVTLTVPVAGTATVNVTAFEGDTEEAIQARAASSLRTLGSVSVYPEEMGTPYAAEDGGIVALISTDDEGDDDEF